MVPPSHSGVQGIYRASGKVRASFEAECSVRTDAEARCGGAAAANIAIGGASGDAEISGISVGSTTAGGGFPISFTVGGTYGGIGASVGLSATTVATSIYNSGEIFRQYIFTTPDTETHFPTLSVDYSGEATASASCVATPGLVYSSESKAVMDVHGEVSDIKLDVVCPPKP